MPPPMMDPAATVLILSSRQSYTNAVSGCLDNSVNVVMTIVNYVTRHCR